MSKVNSYRIRIYLEYYSPVDGKRTYSVETSTNKDHDYSPKKEYIKASDNEYYFYKFFQKTPFNVKTENIISFFKLFNKLPETSLFIMANDKAQEVDIEFSFLDTISPKFATINYNPYSIFTNIEHNITNVSLIKQQNMLTMMPAKQLKKD